MWKDLNEDTKSQVEFKTRFFVCVRVCVPYQEFAVRRVCVCVCVHQELPQTSRFKTTQLWFISKNVSYCSPLIRKKCKLLLTPCFSSFAVLDATVQGRRETLKSLTPHPL